ncbi:patatin-like phospholipase family protein [Millisia brevis]|uniref:patatin-like phospholipase family protein n=1 Tax=Millisia brevis TaxID=264148 RepID=UPI00082CFC6D|nr:patatin-like phospholipase family protein [Millisia brevis]
MTTSSTTPSAYPTDPALECDVVMKGGITSGVIYPRAICELATTYRLRSVGGSSAGAIAAAGAAAAEFGRDGGGFERLESLPREITAESPAGGSVLFRLFQPSRATLALYRALTAGMGASHGVVRTGVAFLTGFWRWALVGALPGVVVVALCAFGTGLPRIAGIVAGVLLALVGLIGAIAFGAGRMLVGVSATGFGLCTGMPGAGARNAAALTPWLHELLQSLSGLPSGEILTFGALADRGIELKTMTTNLTRQQPMTMPWTTHEYFFEPAEMRELFPEDVVRWMEEHPPLLSSDGREPSAADRRQRDLLRAQAGTKRPWPDAADLPVVVATRMSLSFPLLITAVPLYAINYSSRANAIARDRARAWLTAHPDRPATAGASEVPARDFERVWFSDGGICANLPVQFFDAPLPTRPTFAVNLAPFPPDRAKSADEADNCYLPIENSEGLQRPWTPLPTSGLGALPAFLLQIVDTARGWVDAAQLVMPGYRDRVVTIFHDADEGGINLAMPESVVTGLADRGVAAADLLVTKFAGTLPGRPKGWGWENQRWIRFRTSMAGLDDWLGAYREKYDYKAAAGTPYADLAGLGADAPLPSYPFPSAADRTVANEQTAELLATAAAWQADEVWPKRAPRPRPVLRLTPADDSSD